MHVTMKTLAVLALFIGVLGIPLTGNAADDTVNVEFTVTYGQSEARTMLDMINELRTGDDAWYWDVDNTTKVQCTNLLELAYSDELEEVAMQRAAEIALSFSHTRPDGSQCWTAYPSMSIGALGENIAIGNSASAVFTLWAEEDGWLPSYSSMFPLLSKNSEAV